MINRAAIALLLVACGGPGQFMRKAAFDLNCPKEQLTATDVGDDAYGVTGCNQRATYQKVCGTKGFVSNGFGGVNAVRKCNWIKTN